MTDDFLNEETRAEDIILGSLGFGEDASLTSIKAIDLNGEIRYRGTATWSDGEEFEFESDDTLSELELWALNILTHNKQD